MHDRWWHFLKHNQKTELFLQPIQGTSPMALTKEELVNAIAEANGYPRNQSVELVEILLELIKAKLAAGEDVLISGFGKFCVREKRQRRGRNPATGEDMMLDARRVVTFKCSGQLREKINNPQQ
jgi:integration host factor subunit alpha